MSYDLVIAGGKVATTRGMRRKDVGVRSGRIARLGVISPRTRRLSARVEDASGCLVMPGAVDPHVHFDLRIGPKMTTVDDFESGTMSAAAGGVTSIIDYTTPKPGQRPTAAFRDRRRLADRAVKVDYCLHNVLTSWRPGWAGDLKSLASLGAPSVKLFMIYKERGWLADDDMLREVMVCCRRVRVTVCVHAENESLIEDLTERLRAQGTGAPVLARTRPPQAEEEAAIRAIRLAAATGARLHLVHLSTAGAAAQVGRARRRGVRVSGETCPQYLTLDMKLLGRPDGHLWGCCPPLRDRRERDGLWRALGQGWLQAIATDHCAFSRKQKDGWGGDYRKIPYGLPGVETSLAVTYTQGPAAGRLPLHRWVKLHTAGPARLFGLYPRKGSLRPGADADLLIWDPSCSSAIRSSGLQSTCDWNPFEGMQVRGRARQVFLRGKEIAREGRYLESGVKGKFVSPA